MNIAELYRGPLEDFVARRTTLVRELRSTDPEAATAAAKLRKPPVGVWGIDQLALGHPEVITELLAAGADVRDAQQNVAAGTANREDLLAASGRLRDAVEAAAAAATGVLGRAGHAASEQTGRRMRATLQAAATAGAAERRELWAGTLDRDLDAAGFGGVGEPEDDVPELAAILKPMRRRSPSAPRGPSSGGNSTGLEVLARREAERDAANLESVAQRARTAADTKRRQADRLAEEARVAADEASAAENAASAAEEAATAARTTLSG